MNKEYDVTTTIIELNKIFNIFNAKFFDKKLEAPVIIIQSSRKRRTLGTCSVNRIWLNKKTETMKGRYVISISAEYLNRTLDEICATLLHEMIHLYNGLNDIKDTSNNYVYHNKKFKVEAEKRGLVIEHAKTIGWSVTTLQPSTVELVKVELTKDEKLNRLYQRMDRLKERIKQVEAEG